MNQNEFEYKLRNRNQQLEDQKKLDDAKKIETIRSELLKPEQLRIAAEQRAVQELEEAKARYAKYWPILDEAIDKSGIQARFMTLARVIGKGPITSDYKATFDYANSENELLLKKTIHRAYVFPQDTKSGYEVTYEDVTTESGAIMESTWSHGYTVAKYGKQKELLTDNVALVVDLSKYDEEVRPLAHLIYDYWSLSEKGFLIKTGYKNERARFDLPLTLNDRPAGMADYFDEKFLYFYDQLQVMIYNKNILSSHTRSW